MGNHAETPADVAAEARVQCGRRDDDEDDDDDDDDERGAAATAGHEVGQGCAQRGTMGGGGGGTTVEFFRALRWRPSSSGSGDSGIGRTAPCRRRP